MGSRHGGKTQTKTKKTKKTNTACENPRSFRSHHQLCPGQSHWDAIFSPILIFDVTILSVIVKRKLMWQKHYGGSGQRLVENAPAGLPLSRVIRDSGLWFLQGWGQVTWSVSHRLHKKKKNITRDILRRNPPWPHETHQLGSGQHFKPWWTLFYWLFSEIYYTPRDDREAVQTHNTSTII